MKTIQALIVALIVAGCAGYSADQEMAISCRGYAGTLKVLTPLKPRMSPAQIAGVDASVAVLGPACRAAATGGEAAALNAVRAALRALLTIEKEIRP